VPRFRYGGIVKIVRDFKSHFRRKVFDLDTMSFRSIARPLRQCVYSANIVRAPVYNRLYRAYATQAHENPTSSAHQIPTGEAPSPHEVPFTVDSHGPLIQNPKHNKKVVSNIATYTSYHRLKLIRSAKFSRMPANWPFSSTMTLNRIMWIG
jgi:hypothetical protein